VDGGYKILLLYVDIIFIMGKMINIVLENQQYWTYTTHRKGETGYRDTTLRLEGGVVAVYNGRVGRVARLDPDKKELEYYEAILDSLGRGEDCPVVNINRGVGKHSVSVDIPKYRPAPKEEPPSLFQWQG